MVCLAEPPTRFGRQSFRTSFRTSLCSVPRSRFPALACSEGHRSFSCSRFRRISLSNGGAAVASASTSIAINLCKARTDVYVENKRWTVVSSDVRQLMPPLDSSCVTRWPAPVAVKGDAAGKAAGREPAVDWTSVSAR